MANPRNQFTFQPILLDQEVHEKRRVIQQLPVVHQTETLQKFFGATLDHLFDPGKGKPINGYVGQKPLWYDPDQDYYIEEPTDDRTFYQLEAGMVSKNTEGVITDVLPYVDLINQLRFQGALVNNHDRLFRQDFYTWCPPINLDKIINFRQYAWLPLDALTVQLTGPAISYVAPGNVAVFNLPGYGIGADTELATYYDITVLTPGLITATVDGVVSSFTYATGANQLTFDLAPAADAVVNISVYSDLENNAIGLPSAHSKAFGGITLSSNMRVTVVLDKNTDFKSSKTYIVEGVGRSIELIEETGPVSVTPDYMTMERGAINSNEWSTGNRWFHVSTLPDNIDPNYLTGRRANRPIIEFNRNLELFNYGLRRRLDVDLVVENIEDLNGYMNLNPTDITIDNVRFVIQAGGLFSVESTDPSVHLGYGNVSNVRLMVRNTVNSLLNNNVLVLVNDTGGFKLVLETDGSDPSGLPVFGELFKVKLGTYAGKNLHWDGSNWLVSQLKTKVNQSPLFELYDLNRNSLRDAGLYPAATFQGSQLFSYQEDTTGTRVADAVLGIPLVHDSQGQILFQNYLDTETYQYVVGGKFYDITGFYFHKTDNLVADLISYSNDWFKAPGETQQFMVDRYVSDGRTRLFKISQVPTSIQVTRGRVDTGNSFESLELTEDKDFIRIDQTIMMLDIQKGDVLEIKTYSPTNPPVDATGHYEVPLNLQANPDNAEVSYLTKGDFYDHFSEIMKKQSGFTGAEYASNNYRDTPRLPTLGTHIVQHSAPLLKTMLLASNTQLDLVAAMRYSELEYLRFKDKFQKKIVTYISTNQFSSSVSYDVWINTALDDLNKGKTKHFPFYLSGMAQSATYKLPTFIPATPSFLGVYPLYNPEVFSQDVFDAQGNSAAIWFVRGHDGSLTAADSETSARVLQALEMRIFNSIPANIRAQERPSCDWLEAFGDQYRTNDYSYDEFLDVLRAPFERWTVTNHRDAVVNGTYQHSNPWTWNWSSIPTSTGTIVPGHWRGIYEKFFGTQRPDLTPWESLGFTIKPVWWDERYGTAPYTSDNSVLWNDLEQGFIFAGPRAGVNSYLARPGLSANIPVDIRGRLRHPGPRNLIALTSPGPDLMFLGENQPDSYYAEWEDIHDEGVLGCNICPFLPLVNDRSNEWKWGDIGPVEQDWRRSSAYSFAIALASYLMKPSKFVELGWNTQDSVLFFQGTIDEQWLNQDTKGRPGNQDLQIHGEVLADFSLVTKVGIQQWVSDLLASRSTDITVNFADKIRGLGSQLTYKVAGFTDSTTLVPVSDAFGRVPSEDVTVALYRSPSIREESYSGVAIEMVAGGYEIHGYDVLNPSFTVIPPSTTSARISVGSGATAAAVPVWHPNTYYQVNITIRYEDNFYTALKTHTSAVYFEPAYWTQVARPQYADGTALAWYLESDIGAQPVSVPYGTVLKNPQEVANFLNGYQRYLLSRGWIFSDVNSDSTDVNDWKAALGNFVIWSSADLRQMGDFLALSPSSSLVQFTTDQGSIQPIEQLINGLYAIIDAEGQPIDPQTTSVVRSDGNVTVSCDSLAVGIFGLRLYISEIEHILVFNNTTIFNDTIYNPLLNIKQPRLRIQGFRTMSWKGRIDAPGFIVTGDTLTPNFERAADDFRRFFDVESMENKNLQDRARANFGYVEKDYLDNLLLTPTNQFEFYQGMIQQKGSPTSMRRLLRSNFIRNNQGLQLFEEWAFRVGNFGGQDVQPSLDIQILQSEFKHNPQLIEFSTQNESDPVPVDTFGIINVLDKKVDTSNELVELDSRWFWRPDAVNINWPTCESYTADTIADTAGCVNLDEVRFTVPTNVAFEDFYGTQITNSITVEDRDRVWVYGLDSGLPANEAWSTHKFNFTGYNLVNSFPATYSGQGAVVQLDSPLKIIDRSATVSNGRPLDNLYFVSQPLFDQPSVDYVHNGVLPLSNEKLIVRDPNLVLRTTYTPKTANVVSTSLTGNMTSTLMGFVPAAGQFVRRIYVTVTEAFSAGSTLTVGYTSNPEYFIGLKTEPVRDIQPALYTNETILVQTPSTTYVADSVTDAPIDLVRVGTVSNFCADSTVTWSWVPASGPTTTGTVSFLRPSDYSAATNLSDAYLQTITVPTTGSTTTGTLSVYLNGSPVASDTQTISIVKASEVGQSFVDLTQVTSQPAIFDSLFYPATFPWNANGAPSGDDMIATLYNAGTSGNVEVDVEYYYTQGFELFDTSEGTLYPSVLTDSVVSSQLYTWLQTRYSVLTDIVDYNNALNLWDNGDIVEIAPPLITDVWQVYTFDSTYSGSTAPWKLIRQKNRKINSDLLTNAAIFNSNENVLKLVLQLYDPLKGYIPGTADRELDYKLKSDPAVYNTGLMVWGKEHVAKLWWDLSSVRYLDYEIYDDLSNGVNYRWKNWGRIAPNTTVDIYEWVRSPVQPAQWNDYVTSQAALKIDNKPTGSATDQTLYVTESEWNDAIGAEEIVYYFWVLNPTVTPTVEGRTLSALQVSNIILNPSSNDIPFFAVVDANKVIVGGIKQFLNETDTVLKIKWTRDTDIVSNHHKQWIILREQDERNTIPDTLWNKMRDSLVGWDATEAYVPDPKLPVPQQVGSMIRPRQSWFPADVSPTNGIRPNRSSREALAETINDILSVEPFVDQWTGWESLFNAGEALPSSSLYVATALDLVDLANLLPASRNMVQPGECVLVQSTAEVAGFWTLWKLYQTVDGQRSFIIQDFQKWRMQEGELWNLTDWYASGWSTSDFPNYRFATVADLNARGNLDVTLLKGTLVQVDNTDTDGRFTWNVYTGSSNYQVAKAKATMALSDAFYDDARVEFGPVQINAILNTSEDQRITPARIQELADLVNYRDGSKEIEVMLDTFRTTLFSILQKNTLFFSMIKSAFKQSPVVDWAFKTSFLYLGGYAETLQQSPVAFTDQINNVISYLEEVKPYHVTIREYVRRLSYGPDLASLAITDFDKPVYPVGSTNRVLDVTSTADQAIMAQRRPWKDWYSNYTKAVEELPTWDTNWNGVRRMKTTIKYDRISCGTISGWDTSPWDAPLLVFSQIGGTTRSLSQLSALYRTANTGGNPNFYKDQAVETIDDRNLLVRNGTVLASRPGTIVTILQDNTQFMWSGTEWIGFESIGWDQDPDMGSATRIQNSYLPNPGMTRQDDPGLIPGCEFNGTVVTSSFVNDLWDVFEWDTVGFDMGLSYKTGSDYDAIDGNTTPADESDPAYIAVTGGQFSQSAHDSGHPHELVNTRGIENLVFNVTRAGTLAFKQFVDARGHWQVTNAVLSGITFSSWDQAAGTIALTVPSWTEDSNGFTPLHDPQNPSTGFIRDILISKGYRSTTNVDMTSSGTKTFKLRDLGDVTGIPAGIMGDNVKVAVVNANNPSIRAIGTLTNTKGNEASWNGSIQVTFDTGFVDLGQGKSWNIIPVDMFNEPGVVWVDDARFTYTGLTVTGTSVILSNVKLSGSSLNPLVISENAADSSHSTPYNTVVLKSTTTVLDGSKVRQVA